MPFEPRTSIHGRRLALSSSGGIITAARSTGGSNSTDYTMSAQMWGDGLMQTVSSVGSVIRNAGFTVVSSDSTSGSSTLPIFLAAPIAGLYKEIHFQTPATALALNTTSSTIFFNTTLAEAAAGGSTTLTIAGTTLGIGGSIALRGLSTAQWAILSHTVAASS